ncbi:MAG: prepilin-type N-terminal cleavage/methylation domain-containing protein [Rickettsiales bacterium]
MRADHYRKSGFSLVELSIVLVILGLLTGGILGGQSLIHAAELRAVSKEYETWNTAINIFKDKYFGLPGDITNATDFWGAADTSGSGGECGSPGTDAGTGTQTCNGNGDGLIYQSHEPHRFWQHLANAGLITGQYTGTQGSGSNAHSVIGENAPTSKFNSGGWSTVYIGQDSGDATYWLAYDYGHALLMGGQHHSSKTIQTLFSPEDAWNIDTKLDDGRPAQGKMIIHWHQYCTTAADENDSDADYDFTQTGEECSLVFTHAY